MDEELHKIIGIKKLSNSTFILRFERKDVEFKTGQHLGVGPEDALRTREYSIYSAEQDDYLEVLVKEVINGMISPHLARLKEGDFVEVDDPVGSFKLNTDLPKEKRHIFIATGTGIAPYHSFIKTHNLSNYLIIHGIKNISEAYGKGIIDDDKYITCTSQNNSGKFNGRVTKYIQQKMLAKDTSYYLCGNSNMIHEMIDVLNSQGIKSDNINTEVYF